MQKRTCYNITFVKVVATRSIFKSLAEDSKKGRTATGKFYVTVQSFFLKPVQKSANLEPHMSKKLLI